MSAPVAWFLNLDAEEELARPAGYTPSRAMIARIDALTPVLRGERGGAALVGPDDIVVREGQSPSEARGLRGLAWCPTPRARRALSKAGCRLDDAPSLEVLRRVNHRRFSADLGQTLGGAVFAESMSAVREAMSGPSPTGRWLLKRPFAYAGRGRLEVDPSRAGDLERARAWMEASLRAGGLQVEPLVVRRGDFGLHGHLDVEGRLVAGEPTRQECDPTGAWLSSVRAAPEDLTVSERDALFAELRRVAAALHEAGYSGPFGVDAFRHEGPTGQSLFHPRCEINARYSMGWAAGMGDRRPDLGDARP